MMDRSQFYWNPQQNNPRASEPIPRTESFVEANFGALDFGLAA
jgi:hypothetical protein